jgi:predicted patatin/cPLA2 family phospholipase
MYNTENIQVLENLLSHKPGGKDGRKIGLVIQGGGMRGAFGGGVAKVLTDLGLNENFDEIYTSSSGCNTAAYMLAGQTNEGLDIYKYDLSRFRLIRPWNIGKTMNLDYLIDFLTMKKRPLNVEKVLKSRTVLKMYVTNYESGHSEYFTNHQKVDFLAAMKASCAYPNHYPPVFVNGKKYLDGNIAIILPIEQAIQDRCTDILVISTVTEKHNESKQKRSHRAFQSLMSRKFTIDFKDVREHRVELYNHSLDLAFGREEPEGDVRIFTVAPDYMIANASIRSKSIRRFIEHGENKAKQIFESVLEPLE